MTKRQILFDPINIGWPEHFRFFHPPAPFGIFGTQQVTPAGAPVQHLAGTGYFESFSY
jgi:hypothetical protein